jgi:stage IV sporulation protein FB
MFYFSGRIPIRIYPTFWIFAALIGYLNSMSFVGTLTWVGIIFVSVLFHEYGHALTAALFGQKPRIELVAFGGLTYHDGQNLPFWKQFLIVLNGPLFGFLLFIIASILLQFPRLSSGMSGSILNLARIVNLFWTIVNLLPVIPLDGGQLLRIVFEKIFKARGFRYALIASMVTAVLISLFFFLYQSFIIGALFFLLGFQSYDMFRRTRHFSEKDRDEGLREMLTEAEEKMQTGQKEEALALFETVRKQAKEGMLYSLATQYAAFLKYETGYSKEAYELLVSIDQKNFPLVAELGGGCFQAWPTAETALRNAYAHGALGQAVPAIGWLQTAIQEGVHNLEEVLADESFNSIRQDPSFQHLLSSLKKN